MKIDKDDTRYEPIITRDFMESLMKTINEEIECRLTEVGIKVVMCKDCQYYVADDKINSLKFCELSDRPRDEDFYCKFGKRKNKTE